MITTCIRVKTSASQVEYAASVWSPWLANFRQDPNWEGAEQNWTLCNTYSSRVPSGHQLDWLKSMLVRATACATGHEQGQATRARNPSRGLKREKASWGSWWHPDGARNCLPTKFLALPDPPLSTHFFFQLIYTDLRYHRNQLQNGWNLQPIDWRLGTLSRVNVHYLQSPQPCHVHSVTIRHPHLGP